MKFFGIILLALSFQINRAEAGVLIEPYVGYQALVTESPLGSGASTFEGQSISLDDSGIGFGARVGFTSPMFFAAVDYSSANLKSKLKSQPEGLGFTTEDQTRTSLGATIGLNFPVLRPYVGYIFDDQIKEGSDVRYGTGFKLGIGFTILPKLKLNAEYQMATYTKVKDSSGTESTFGSNQFFKSVKASGFFVNLSLPLEI